MLRRVRKICRCLYQDECGFTLIELIIVAILLGILVIVFTSGIKGKVTKAKQDKVIADLRAMKTVLDTYFNDYGEYPKGRRNGWGTPTINDVMREHGINWDPYSLDGLRDPWGHAYVYRTPQVIRPGMDTLHGGPFMSKYRTGYLLFSCGPDRQLQNGWSPGEQKQSKDDIYVTHNRSPAENLTNWRTRSEFVPEFGVQGGNDAYESRSCLDTSILIFGGVF
ncbi:MAG: type II secretion system protein GspG [Bacillota bacterium]